MFIIVKYFSLLGSCRFRPMASSSLTAGYLVFFGTIVPTGKDFYRMAGTKSKHYLESLGIYNKYRVLSEGFNCKRVDSGVRARKFTKPK